MVDQLANDYAGKPVLFIEYDAIEPWSRYEKFMAADPGGPNPTVMADSGHQVQTGGWPNYYDLYKNMVDQELLRPPQAEVTATWLREGNKVKFTVQVKNLANVTLSQTVNQAAVHAIVYEDVKVVEGVTVTSRYWRAAVYQYITTALAPEASATFTLNTPDLAGVDWTKLHYVALVDYRPSKNTGPYDMLQAAVAQPASVAQPLN